MGEKEPNSAGFDYKQNKARPGLSIPVPEQTDSAQQDGPSPHHPLQGKGLRHPVTPNFGCKTSV